MAGYTPTTEQVEEHYIYDRYDNAEGTQVLEEAEAEFRRWLAVHEAAIRADEREKVLAAQKWEYGLMRDDGHVDIWGVCYNEKIELAAMREIANKTGERIVRRIPVPPPGPWVRVEPVNESEKPSAPQPPQQKSATAPKENTTCPPKTSNSPSKKQTAVSKT